MEILSVFFFFQNRAPKTDNRVYCDQYKIAFSTYIDKQFFVSTKHES